MLEANRAAVFSTFHASLYDVLFYLLSHQPQSFVIEGAATQRCLKPHHRQPLLLKCAELQYGAKKKRKKTARRIKTLYIWKLRAASPFNSVILRSHKRMISSLQDNSCYVAVMSDKSLLSHYNSITKSNFKIKGGFLNTINSSCHQ